MWQGRLILAWISLAPAIAAAAQAPSPAAVRRPEGGTGPAATKPSGPTTRAVLLAIPTVPGAAEEASDPRLAKGHRERPKTAVALGSVVSWHPDAEDPGWTVSATWFEVDREALLARRPLRVKRYFLWRSADEHANVMWVRRPAVVDLDPEVGVTLIEADGDRRYRIRVEAEPWIWLPFVGDHWYVIMDTHDP